MERFNQLEHLEEVLGQDETIDSIVKAMSNDAFNEIYKFICQTHGIEERNEEI